MKAFLFLSILLPVFANAQKMEIKQMDGFFWAGTAISFIVGSDSATHPIEDLYPGMVKHKDSTVILIHSIKAKKPIAKFVIRDGHAQMNFGTKISGEYLDLCREAFQKVTVINNKDGCLIAVSN